MRLSNSINPEGYHKNTLIVCSPPHEGSETTVQGSTIFPEFNIMGNIIVSGENYLLPDY